MLAKRLPTILPPLTLEEALETRQVYSRVGQLSGERLLIVERPSRTPHHTASDTALIGGRSDPRPGEVSLAHNGVLFLDELAAHQCGAVTIADFNSNGVLDAPATGRPVDSISACAWSGQWREQSEGSGRRDRVPSVVRPGAGAYSDGTFPAKRSLR